MRDSVANTDPVVAALLQAEDQRQAEDLCLIPSENYASAAVLEANGTALVNKYSEGYPGKRYYEGNELIDQVEQLAIDRAKALFGVEHANVQPYSGSPANLAVYLAFMQPGDTVMGLSLLAGGHLTHGWGVSVTGKWFNSVHYGVRRDTGQVDLDEVRALALDARPKVIFCGGTAVPRTVDFEGFARVAHEVDALLVADISHIAGLVVGGVHPSPVGHADIIMTTTHKTLRGPRGAILMSGEEHATALDRAVFPGLQGGPHQHQTAAIAVTLHEAGTDEFRQYAQRIVTNAQRLAESLLELGFDLVSGGTDNHLLLVDVTSKGVTGKPAATGLNAAGIVTNANAIPFDTRKPLDPSGIRIGTPAATTRGMGVTEMEQTAHWMSDALAAVRDGNPQSLKEIRKEVHELTARFPAPGLEVPATTIAA